MAYTTTINSQQVFRSPTKEEMYQDMLDAEKKSRDLESHIVRMEIRASQKATMMEERIMDLEQKLEESKSRELVDFQFKRMMVERGYRINELSLELQQSQVECEGLREQLKEQKSLEKRVEDLEAELGALKLEKSNEPRKVEKVLEPHESKAAKKLLSMVIQKLKNKEAKKLQNWSTGCQESE